MKTKHLSFASASVALLFSQWANAVNVIEAIDAAKVNDPTFRSAIYERDAQKQDARLGLSFLLPSINASSSTGQGTYDQSSGGLNSSKLVSITNQTIQIRQVLISPESLERMRAGKVSANQADFIFIKKELDLLVRVLSTYLDVLSAIDQRKLAIAQVNALKEQVAFASRQLNGGDSSKLDVLEAIAKADLAQAQLLEAEQSLSINVKVLESITGLKIETIESIQEAFIPIATEPNDLEQLLAITMDNNPDINAARKQVELAYSEVNRARAGHVPRLDLVAQRTRSESDTVNTINLKTDSHSLLLQLQVPIFSGFAVNALTDKNLKLLQKAQADLEGTIQKITIELRKQYIATVLSGNKMSAYLKAVESADEALKASQIGQRTGLRIQLDTLNAEQQLYQSKMNYSKVRYEAILSLMKLKITTGIFNVTDLKYFRRMMNGGIFESVTQNLHHY